MADTGKRAVTIMVHELLAFVQNKLDVMDELSLEQICASSYTETEILAAKTFLEKTAVTTVHLASRRGDGVAKKTLYVIFRVFKETDSDNVPTYVAKDFSKLPPVSFDHVDATSLLRTIMASKIQFESTRVKLEAKEKMCAGMRLELTSLRSTYSALPSTKPLIRNAPTQQVADKQNNVISN